MIADRMREFIPHSTWINEAFAPALAAFVTRAMSGYVIIAEQLKPECGGEIFLKFHVFPSNFTHLWGKLVKVAEEAKRLRESPSAGGSEDKTGN